MSSSNQLSRSFYHFPLCLLLLICLPTRVDLSSTSDITGLPVSPTNPSSRHKSYLVQAGQSVNLTCPHSAPFYSWTRHGTSERSIDRTLRLDPATLDDSGRYTCQAVDGYQHASAEMALRVIGPCFLTPLTDRDLNPSLVWGESAELDCEAVLAEVSGGSTGDELTYHWDYSPPPRSSRAVDGASRRRYQPGSDLAAELQHFTQPVLGIDKLSLRHSGIFRCSVGRRSLYRSSGGVGDSYPQPVLQRTFKLSVEPRADGPVIQGPHSVNETVEVGTDAVFSCEIDSEEHRSTTIRWGKSISPTDGRSSSASDAREVIQWAGGTFSILPSVPHPISVVLGGGSSSADLKSTNDGQRGSNSRGPLRVVATEASPSQSSQLIIREASLDDSGRYVCSVLTESGLTDHKFVFVRVTGDSSGLTGSLIENDSQRLAWYISIPTVVFVICLCVVTYCLVTSRYSRNNRNLINSTARRRMQAYNAAAHASQIKSPSAASSGSLGVGRNGGLGATTCTWVSGDDGRLRLSGSNGVNHANGHLYSPPNGSSNPGSGVGPLLASGHPPYHSNVAPQPVSSYPTSALMAIQHQGNGSTGLYSIPDAHLSTPSSNGLYPPPAVTSPQGVVYPTANGSVVDYSTDPSVTLPNYSMMYPSLVSNNLSSPDSSAITAPNSSHLSNEVEPSVHHHLMPHHHHFHPGNATPVNGVGHYPASVGNRHPLPHPAQSNNEFDHLIGQPSYDSVPHGSAIRT